MELTDFQSTETFQESQTKFRELHLYQGSFCNRVCDFCTVYGSSTGWYADYTPKILDLTLRMMDMDGHIKFYGGEPTIKHENQIWAIRYLRQNGFTGKFTLFSNGVKANQLIEILDSDSHIDCALNYSIWTGRGADPLPIPAQETIKKYVKSHPDKFYLAHPDIIGSGRAMDWYLDVMEYPTFGDECPLCHPVITTRGEILACPFNVENDTVYHKLGKLDTSPEEVMQNYKEFRKWVIDVLHPASKSTGKRPCYFCNHQPESLTPPRYVENKQCEKELISNINP